MAGFALEDAVTLEDLETCRREGRSLPWCDPAQLLGFPVIELDEQQVRDVSNGRELSAGSGGGTGCVSCVARGRLLAVYAQECGRLKPATVIPGGVVGVA